MDAALDVTLLQATEVTEKTLLELHCDKSELLSLCTM